MLVDEKNTSYHRRVFVIGDVRHLQAYLKNLFPNDAVTAIAVRESVVLRGYVSGQEDIPRIIDIAKEFYPNVINQMEVGGDQEIELKVRVIESTAPSFANWDSTFWAAQTLASWAAARCVSSALDPQHAHRRGSGLAVNPTNFAANPSLLGAWSTTTTRSRCFSTPWRPSRC